MIVSNTGLAKKVLLTGSPTKFVIAIAQIEQTSYRATTNIRESLGQSFSTYILVLMIVEICFISFKKAWWIPYMYRVCPFMKDYWLIMNSWLLINCAFHILRLDDYVIKVQTQQFHSFVVILAFIPEFVQFCFNKEVFINWNQKGYNLYVTFLATGHVATYSQQCSGPIAVFPTTSWFWIGAFSLSCLYTTNWLGTDTPGVPLTPATIHWQCCKQKHLINDIFGSFNETKYVGKWCSLYFYLSL